MSLVELLVALAIALFVLAGLVSVFATNKHAIRVHEAANVLQENGRFSVNQLAHSIRMAGHWGGIPPADIQKDGGLSATGIGGCDQSWITDIESSIRGYDGVTTVNTQTPSAQGFPTDCIAASDYVAGTDVLVVRYAEPDTSIAQPSVFFRAGIGTRGVVGNAPAAGALPTFGIPGGDGTIDYPYRIEVWFVRPCRDPSGGSSSTACDSSDDDGTPMPTLARLALNGTTLVQQGMYDGIEDLQLEYGRDTDGDGRVDRIDTAATLNVLTDPRTAWSEVISVQIALIARSGQQDATYSSAQQFSLTGDKGAGTNGFRAPTTKQHFLRKGYQQTAQLRNAVR